jgi:hypothetical protein
MLDFTLVQNMINAIGEREQVEKIATKMRKFRIGGSHIESGNVWVEPYKTRVQIPGFDQEYSVLKAHFQSTDILLGAFRKIEGQLAGLHTYSFERDRNFLCEYNNGQFQMWDARIDPENVLDAFNECYTLGLGAEALDCGKPLSVIRSELGLSFEAKPAVTGDR